MKADGSELYRMPVGIQTRWASPENWKGGKGLGGQEFGGRKGSPSFSLPDGESRVLAEVNGSSGTLRRFWCTISDRSPQMLRGLRLEMYWDGCSQPAVSVPFGDFFMHGLGRMAVFETAMFASPEGRSFVCYLPMPFKTGMKVIVHNESGLFLPMFFYDINYTLGDEHGEGSLYLHSFWRRENPTSLQRDFEILPAIHGKGRFLGANLGVIADQKLYFNSWWGEGEVKVFLDGDVQWPTLCGTGTEDYIGTGWGQGQYANLYQGCHLADHQRFEYCFYRFHNPDPIYFYQDIRVTIQQIGCWSPENIGRMRNAGLQLVQGPERQPVDMDEAALAQMYGLFERQDDWSSCAYFYLDQPINHLPALASANERTAGLEVTP